MNKSYLGNIFLETWKEISVYNYFMFTVNLWIFPEFSINSYKNVGMNVYN